MYQTRSCELTISDVDMVPANRKTAANDNPIATRPGDLLRGRDGSLFAAVFLFAGTMSTSRDRSGSQDRVWYVFLLLPSFAVYVTVDGRRDQPRPVRPSRGRR